jgi:hypothetical protein
LEWCAKTAPGKLSNAKRIERCPAFILGCSWKDGLSKEYHGTPRVDKLAGTITGIGDGEFAVRLGAGARFSAGVPEEKSRLVVAGRVAYIRSR